MKIEQLIVQHLYASKKVSLQGIGTLYLNSSVALPGDNDKDFVMPEGAVTFDYNLKAEEDTALINFIVEKTRKIKPLATSDLESYSMLAKQFLNIGKPLEMDGVGTIQKNQAGIYEFIPGNFVMQKNEEPPKALKSKAEETISFESESQSSNSKKNLLIVLGLLALILGGLGIYHFLFNNNASSQSEPEAAATTAADTLINKDTAITQAVTIDSAALQPVATPVVTDSNQFSIVIKEYPTAAAASKAMDKLSSYGHKLELITQDSTNYKLTMPFTYPLSDTARVRDSLRKFFGGRPYVFIK